jgi:uncharacterized Zn finger protein
MTCPKCHGWTVPEVVETPEGRLSLVHCLNCGFASDRLMVQHRIVRPKPFRQLPAKPNRASR